MLQELHAPVVKVGDTAPLARVVAYKPKPWLSDDMQLGGSLFDEKLVVEPFTTNLEQTALYEPDLILTSPYEKLDNVEKLSKIAPTITPKVPNPVEGTPYSDVVLTALGYTQDERSDYQRKVKEVLKDGGFYDFEDTAPTYTKLFITDKIAIAPFGYFDKRWEKAGWKCEVPGSLDSSNTLSVENLDQLQSDVLFVNSEREVSESLLTKDPRWANLPAVKNNRVFYTDEPKWNSADSVDTGTITGAKFFVNSDLFHSIWDSLKK